MARADGERSLPPGQATVMMGAMLCRGLFCVVLLGGCHGGAAPGEGERVEAPFTVRGDAEGLMLVWYDEEGPHTATHRSEIPEAHRALVRVDDLARAPEERGDPDHVWVADLGEPGQSGAYPVRRMSREDFEARAFAGSESPTVPAGEQVANADVVIYGASWCGACRSTAAFLRERGVPFVERDIERDPGARTAMQRAAEAAGLHPSGIPVIDFRGRVIAGFDRGALERAIRETQAPI